MVRRQLLDQKSARYKDAECSEMFMPCGGLISVNQMMMISIKTRYVTVKRNAKPCVSCSIRTRDSIVTLDRIVHHDHQHFLNYLYRRYISGQCHVIFVITLSDFDVFFLSQTPYGLSAIQVIERGCLGCTLNGF